MGARSRSPRRHSHPSTDFGQLGEFLDTAASEGSTTIDLGAAASDGDEVGTDVLIVGSLTSLTEDDFIVAA